MTNAVIRKNYLLLLKEYKKTNNPNNNIIYGRILLVKVKLSKSK